MPVDPNPYAIPPGWDELQESPPPRDAGKPKTRIESLLLFLICATCVIGSTVSTFVVESIIPSGIILSALGILLVSREMYARRKRASWPMGLIFGFSGPVFSLFVFVLILTNEWGPAEAKRKGVPTLCIVFAVAMCAFVILAYRELLTCRQLNTDSAEYELDQSGDDESWTTE